MTENAASSCHLVILSFPSLSPNSLPHSVVFNYIWELPFGKDRRWLNDSEWLDRVVGGWQITGIHRYRSGPALTPFIAGGQRDFLTLVGYGGNLRPNITGNQFYTFLPTLGVDYRYLNPSAFARPPDFRNTRNSIESRRPSAAIAETTDSRAMGFHSTSMKSTKLRPRTSSKV